MRLAARLGPQLVLESIVYAKLIEDYNADCCQAGSTIDAYIPLVLAKFFVDYNAYCCETGSAVGTWAPPGPTPRARSPDPPSPSPRARPPGPDPCRYLTLSDVM